MTWEEVAHSQEGFGALTCPYCFGQIVGNSITGYYCDNDLTPFVNEDISDLFKLFYGTTSPEKDVVDNRVFVVYKKGTWKQDRAIFLTMHGLKAKRKTGAFNCTRFADKFTWEQIKYLCTHPKTSWKYKVVSTV